MCIKGLFCPNRGLKDKWQLNEGPLEHSAILLTFNKRYSVLKNNFLSFLKVTKYRENDCGWRTSNPNTSLTQIQFDKRIPYGALNACGVGLVLSPSAHVGSGNHGDMVLIHHGKRHDANAFILEMLMPFSGVPRCGQL